MQIGNIKTGITALGPMAGVTDHAFRKLCKRHGAGILFTEMVSAKGLLYKNSNTEELLETDESEGPIGIQLFGNDPLIMSKAAEILKDRNFDFVDINMGCPVPKVVNNGEGSALMKNPDLVYDIVKEMVKTAGKPVSVKIRKGFSKTDNNAPEVAKAAECGGAAFVTVHGRTREDYYSGKADWDIIGKVKAGVSIPVIGNGDIFAPEDAKRMLDKTGVDAVMIGRGAQGNPWIFERINTYLETGELLPEVSVSERIETALEHARMEIELKGEYTGIREMRKHVAWYMSGFPGAGRLRSAVNYTESYDELKKLLYNYET